MNPKEPRKIWLVTHKGVPLYGAWALVKTWDEAEERQSWACALDEAQSADPDWDATPTAWRRMPRLIQPGITERLRDHRMLATPELRGRHVHVAGLKFDIDRGGRPHPQHTDAEPMEPLEPDAEVEDLEHLQRVVDETGMPVSFTEHRSRKAHAIKPRR